MQLGSTLLVTPGGITSNHSQFGEEELTNVPSSDLTSMLDTMAVDDPAGGVFIRSDSVVESTQARLVKPKRTAGWLSFLYSCSSGQDQQPQVHQQHSPITSKGPSPSASSSSGSDIESESILVAESPTRSPKARSVLGFRRTPTPPVDQSVKPLKGILKTTLNCSKSSQPIQIPDQGQRTTFRRREELSRFSAVETAGSDGKRNRVSFDSQVFLYETWRPDEYDRTGIDYVAKCITPDLATIIKRELNELKMEMEVHESSRKYTQFYRMPLQAPLPPPGIEPHQSV